ncbi:MAG: penicillin acylase family protein, partial [Gammaproteobacteria bacterium]|nr:penicillin acylase family protein [Gammaproteobacteria bacterium]
RQPVRVLRWIAHFPHAVNMNLLELEQANDVPDALNTANTIGIPAQNIIVTDKRGQIGWSIAGIIPKRSALDNEIRTPISWTEAENSWQSWLEPQHYPQVINPDSHRLWTANSRVIAGDAAYKIGDGGFVLGARATQIRNRLQATEKFNEKDLLAIQLDDRAFFLDRWQHFILELLSKDTIDKHPERQQFRQLIEAWTGHASTESVAYRLVRAYRVFVAETIFTHIMSPAINQDSQLNPLFYKRYETPLWQLINEQPEAYLPKKFPSWEALLLAGVDDVVTYFESKKIPLEDASWGQRNTLAMAHPLSLAVPLLSPLINAAAVPLPGDRYMPRVQSPDFGASIRFVVAPGHEENGILQLPAGQSGHPLSPFYMAGHNDWLTGKATPLLPGKTQYTLTLVPQ